MTNGIRIGGEVNKGVVGEFTKAIEAIFKSGQLNGMEQSTICKALDVLITGAVVRNSTVQNCVIDGGKTIHVHTEPQPDPYKTSSQR